MGSKQLHRHSRASVYVSNGLSSCGSSSTKELGREQADTSTFPRQLSPAEHSGAHGCRRGPLVMLLLAGCRTEQRAQGAQHKARRLLPVLPSVPGVLVCSEGERVVGFWGPGLDCRDS